MLFQAALFLSALYSTLTLPVFAALPKGTVTCGSNRYSPSQLTAAINAAIKDMNGGVYPDDYPHQYYDEPSENIQLWCSGNGPWYEFPLVPGGAIYTSTPDHYVSPGTDRVIFAGSGTYCAVVTHTGASTRNGFVACQGD